MDLREVFYRATIDNPAEEFETQEDEVAEIKWFTKEELKRLAREHPEEFLSSMPQWIKLFA